MMTTFKVACNDDEVVVMHSGLEGYIKSKCSSVVCLFVLMPLKCLKKANKNNVCNVMPAMIIHYLNELSFYPLILLMSSPKETAWSKR